jgi:surfactin synthase thioesterase subunit
MTGASVVAAQRDLWVRPVDPFAGARLRLFCLPFAGGGTVQFRRFARSLPKDIQVCPVCLPGREDRRLERPYDRMEPLVAALVLALQPWLDRPYAIYGHSMGGLVAFELARALRARPPERIIVSGRGAPQLVQRAPALATLSDEDLVKGLVERYNAVPRAVLAEPELLAIFIPIFRADLAVLENYEHRPGPPLELPLTVVGGRSDFLVSEPELAAWREHTVGPFRQEMVEGDHFFIQNNPGPFLSLLAEELQK